LHYRIYQDAGGYWRWTFYAANNYKLADSGEGYSHRTDCLHGIALVKGSANAPIYE